jgi:hypothetical protein
MTPSIARHWEFDRARRNAQLPALEAGPPSPQFPLNQRIHALHCTSHQWQKSHTVRTAVPTKFIKVPS